MTTPTPSSRVSSLTLKAARAFSHIHQLAHAQVAPDLTIGKVSSNFRSVLVDPEISAEGLPLADVLDEFKGTEPVLRSIMQGTMPSFQLDQVGRDLPDGSIRYLTFHILPVDENRMDAGLLLLVENVTRFGQMGQALIQSRNETRLMQDALSDAYDELQRIALADRYNRSMCASSSNTLLL